LLLFRIVAEVAHRERPCENSENNQKQQLSVKLRPVPVQPLGLWIVDVALTTNRISQLRMTIH